MYTYLSIRWIVHQLMLFTWHGHQRHSLSKAPFGKETPFTSQSFILGSGMANIVGALAENVLAHSLSTALQLKHINNKKPEESLPVYCRWSKPGMTPLEKATIVRRSSRGVRLLINFRLVLAQQTQANVYCHLGLGLTLYKVKRGVSTDRSEC